MKTLHRELNSATPDLDGRPRADGDDRRARRQDLRLVPGGTGPDVGKTRAKPEIWQQPADLRRQGRTISGRRAGVRRRRARRATSNAIKARLRATSTRRARRATTPIARTCTIEQPGDKQPVWDLPVRLFHWLLAGADPFSWWSVNTITPTGTSGRACAILTLLIFRLLWGSFGSSTARFANFVRGPRGVRDYLRGTTGAAIGHTPLGALSVVAMLGRSRSRSGSA